MHSAPAVRYSVGRSRWHGLLLLGLSGVGLLAFILWTLSFDPPGWRQGLFVLLFVPAVALAWRQWWRWPSGVLVWDGSIWHWLGPARARTGILRPHVDVQFGLLLSLRDGPGRVQWVWAQRGVDHWHWLDLRRAVYAPAVAVQAGQTASDSLVLPP